MTHIDDDTPNPAPDSELTDDVWADVRDAYRAGWSGPVIAERYGLSLRSVRRKAADQGWRRQDGLQGQFCQELYRGRADPEELKRASPGLAAVSGADVRERSELLVQPTPDAFRYFAFKRAAEAAAMDLPAQSLAWMRLIRAADRLDGRIERDSSFYSKADHLRATIVEVMAHDAMMEAEEEEAREREEKARQEAELDEGAAAT